MPNETKPLSDETDMVRMLDLERKMVRLDPTLVPDLVWDRFSEIIGKNPEMPVGIGREEGGIGWFIIGTAGQGPFLIWQEVSGDY